MGKNPKKYKYLDVGLAWDSWTLAQLEADAKFSQMEEQPAKLAAIRLGEYYKLVSLGIIVPGVTVLSPPVVGSSARMTPPAPPARSISTSRQRPAKEEPIIENAILEEVSDTGANADAALGYYDDIDEEDEEGEEREEG